MDIMDLQEFQSITYRHEKERINEQPVERILDRVGNLFDKLRDARDLMPEGKITSYETARLLSESIGSLKAIHEHLFTEFTKTIDGKDLSYEQRREESNQSQNQCTTG